MRGGFFMDNFKGKYSVRLLPKDPLDLEIDKVLVNDSNRSEYIRQAIRLRYTLEKAGISIATGDNPSTAWEEHNEADDLDGADKEESSDDYLFVT